MSDFIVEYTIKIASNGDVTNDVVTNGHSFAEVYRGFLAIREEVERQINERRECPYNPKYGKEKLDALQDQVEHGLQPLVIRTVRTLRRRAHEAGRRTISRVIRRAHLRAHLRPVGDAAPDHVARGAAAGDREA